MAISSRGKAVAIVALDAVHDDPADTDLDHRRELCGDQQHDREEGQHQKGRGGPSERGWRPLGGVGAFAIVTVAPRGKFTCLATPVRVGISTMKSSPT